MTEQHCVPDPVLGTKDALVNKSGPGTCSPGAYTHVEKNQTNVSNFTSYDNMTRSKTTANSKAQQQGGHNLHGGVDCGAEQQGLLEMMVITMARKWQPTPVILPGESHGQRRLVGYSPCGSKVSDTTSQLNNNHQQSISQLITQIGKASPAVICRVKRFPLGFPLHQEVL